MRRGRYWVGLWLAFVLLTMAMVVNRQTSAHVILTSTDSLENLRTSLEAQKAVQLSRIREGLSRASLGPRAEGIGMRFPVDSEIVFLEMPSRLK
jgi:hypothetical protein